MSNNLYSVLTERFPFLSIVTYGLSGDEFVGIIQNADSVTTSLYDFGALKKTEDKKKFLELGEKWYFESNRQLPINIFLKEEWQQFDSIFKTFITRELTIVHGPCTSLAALSSRKKRRSMFLVKKPESAN